MQVKKTQKNVKMDGEPDKRMLPGLKPKKLVFHPPRDSTKRASNEDPILKQYQRERKGSFSGIVRYF